MHAGMLAHALDRLAGTARVLFIAAHPDDENTRLLAYLANDRHVTAAYLSMTRGGGGQNLIGTEQGELLDVLRTEELLQARSLDGARQRFTRMRDFGFSKTAAETLAIWDHDQALSDVVWVIRTYQPDVIIARFNELPPFCWLPLSYLRDGRRMPRPCPALHRRRCRLKGRCRHRRSRSMCRNIRSHSRTSPILSVLTRRAM